MFNSKFLINVLIDSFVKDAKGNNNTSQLINNFAAGISHHFIRFQNFQKIIWYCHIDKESIDYQSEIKCE